MFPKHPVGGVFVYLVMFESELYDFSHLSEWPNLEKVSIFESRFNCSLVEDLAKLKIQIEIDSDPCSSTTQMTQISIFDRITSTKQSTQIHLTNRFTITQITTPDNTYSRSYYTTSISYTESSTLFNKTAPFSSQVKNGIPKKIKLIIGSVFAILGFLVICIFAVSIFVKKKVKISRLPPNLPTRSEIDITDPSGAIEMESFDSFDFESSTENIYEIPNPIYSNV
jgi:hypothetical protein